MRHTIKRHQKSITRFLAFTFALNLVICGLTASNGVSQTARATHVPLTSAQPKPLPAPARWRGLIGEYELDGNTLYILEKDGKLCALFKS